MSGSAPAGQRQDPNAVTDEEWRILRSHLKGLFTRDQICNAFSMPRAGGTGPDADFILDLFEAGMTRKLPPKLEPVLNALRDPVYLAYLKQSEVYTGIQNRWRTALGGGVAWQMANTPPQPPPQQAKKKPAKRKNGDDDDEEEYSGDESPLVPQPPPSLKIKVKKPATRSSARDVKKQGNVHTFVE